MKTSNKQNFVIKAIKIHGNGTYNYSKVNYINAHIKVIIICPKHGEFKQTPNGHLCGKGCKKCASIKLSKLHLLSQEEVINNFKNVHGNKWDYSLVNYKSTHIKVIIICPKHGEFKQTPSAHLRGDGCPKCRGMYRTTEEAIALFENVHKGRYDYSKYNYITCESLGIIICRIHGEFKMSFHNHLAGKGCKRCGIQKNINNQKKKIYDLLKEFDLSHNNSNISFSYPDIEKYYINNHTKIPILCNQCKKVFWREPITHKKGFSCPYCSGWHRTLNEWIEIFENIHGKNKYGYSEIHEINSSNEIISVKCYKHGIFKTKASYHQQGSGCPKCKLSHGENIIEIFLKENNIIYEIQKKFKDCKYKNFLKFDFYLPEYNMCIEYDGGLHFKPVEYFGGEEAFEKTKMRDQIKNDYCKNNNIKLVRIPYWEFNNIKNILNDNIKI